MSHQAKVCCLCGETLADDEPRRSVPDISPYLVNHECAPVSKYAHKLCANNAIPTANKEMLWKALPSTLSI